jgi:hypothetical protein
MMQGDLQISQLAVACTVSCNVEQALSVRQARRIKLKRFLISVFLDVKLRPLMLVIGPYLFLSSFNNSC